MDTLEKLSTEHGINMSPDDWQQAERDFNYADTDGSGTISYEELEAQLVWEDWCPCILENRKNICSFKYMTQSKSNIVEEQPDKTMKQCNMFILSYMSL